MTKEEFISPGDENPPPKKLVIQYQRLSPEIKHIQATLNRFNRLYFYIYAYATVIKEISHQIEWGSRHEREEWEIIK